MNTLREAAQQALETCTDVVSGWESLAPLAVRQAAIESLDNLSAALAESEQNKTQITHAEGCWSWGPAHYECACRELAKAKGWKK